MFELRMTNWFGVRFAHGFYTEVYRGFTEVSPLVNGEERRNKRVMSSLRLGSLRSVLFTRRFIEGSRRTTEVSPLVNGEKR